MAGWLQSRNTGVRILLGVILGIIALSMLLYLVPQGNPSGSAPDTLAEVGGQAVTVLDVRRELQKIESRGRFPKTLEPLYAQQILGQLIFQHELELEGKRLGIRVTDEERAERIRQLVPTAYNGDTFVGVERYSAEVQFRFQMGIAEFEELVRQGLLEEKFRRLVTDGISVTPEEVQQEFKRRNEKIKLDYVLIKPEEMESKVTISDAETAASFEKNKARYPIPERRIARYAVLDINQLRQHVQISDDELRAQYTSHLDQYQVPNRVHAEHILFKTVGKTDAEVEEIRKKAEDVLKKAKKGAKFEDLAKQYSEDTSKDKGGDLGWIVQGQTVPEFEKAAFSLPKGGISDLVRTQYGFHIIKVLDHENAHTKPFEEVRESIRAPLLLGRADQKAEDVANQIFSVIRRSNRTPLDDVAKQFSLTTGETRPLTVNDPVLELGNSKEVRDSIFSLRVGELSQPIRTDRGYVVLSVRDIQPSHPGTLAEVRDRVLADLRREKGIELAKKEAGELAKRSQGGENFQAAAKALGLEAKTSDAFPRIGSIPNVGSAKQVSDAFRLPTGQTGAPLHLGANWLVYRVVEHDEAKQEDFEKQRRDLEEQVLQSKQGLAYEAFRQALEDRLMKEGKVKRNPAAMKAFGTFGG
ncbi:MAG TPA: peptidylprolyl isomerase [Candidatus Acidoferrales bacterium]|nr:peptidylprolyl isomerase [Candidatus Acidoferrales bacterium]